MPIGQQPERNTLYAQYSGEGSENGYIAVATIYDQNRQEVPYDQISQFALDAAVAGEDERFFTHGGVDVQSVIRTALDNVVAGGIEGGSSTLSMQLVKQIFVQRALELPTEEERKAGLGVQEDPETFEAFRQRQHELRGAEQAALVGLARSWAAELAPRGITVNAICPGWVENSSFLVQQARERAAAEGVSEEAARATLLGKQPTGRFVGESDVGALIAFLCSDAADQIRGAAMSIDGGWCAQ